MQKLSFDAWMKQVDEHVQRRVHVSVYDLPDCCFRDWYNDDMTPAQAASEAVKNAE